MFIHLMLMLNRDLTQLEISTGVSCQRNHLPILNLGVEENNWIIVVTIIYQ